MNERIKEVRKQLKLTQASFGARLGVSRDAIASIEYGNSKPTEIVVRSIVREFNVDYGWLKDGIGEMFSKQEDEFLAVIDDLATGENETAKAILRAMTKLTDEQWSALDALLDVLEKERKR